MEGKQKILVCGDVEGKFKTLFSRVSTINEKSGPFDFLLCVGDFFGASSSTWEPYKSGVLKVPVPTYILGPSKPEHVPLFEDINGCEMCPNVSYLGKRGILSSSGLKIAYLSGLNCDERDVTTVRDVAFKSPDFHGVDLLLTSAWPKDVMNNDSARHDVEGTKFVSWLACQLKPRYHFAGVEDIYYERPPYANHNTSDDGPIHCTRFIALAKVGNAGKKKWLYAASLTPIGKMKKSELHQVTSDQTPCPYPLDLARFRDGPQQFFYDMNAQVEAKRKRRNSEEGPKKRPVFDQSTCWFCLASPEVQKHLVISIGEEVYVALPRGGLTNYHVMILPIQHHQSLVQATESIRKETKKYKSALKKFYKTRNLAPVFFERNYKTSHLQLQVIPIPAPMSKRVKEVFFNSAEEQSLELHELPEHSHLEDIAQVGYPYFYVELPSKERLFCSCKKNFPLMFGRDVLASDSLLDLPDKVDWKDCTLPKDEEERLVKTFRSEFKDFDPQY